MTPEEMAAKAAADVARHEADQEFLRAVGQALSREADARRQMGVEPLTPVQAAEIVAKL